MLSALVALAGVAAAEPAVPTHADRLAAIDAAAPETRSNEGGPDGESTIWCYTTDSDTRWEYCDPIDGTTV